MGKKSTAYNRCAEQAFEIIFAVLSIVLRCSRTTDIGSEMASVSITVRLSSGTGLRSSRGIFHQRSDLLLVWCWWSFFIQWATKDISFLETRRHRLVLCERAIPSRLCASSLDGWVCRSRSPFCGAVQLLRMNQHFLAFITTFLHCQWG